MKNMDIEILNELIGKCEDHMASPFKKKKEMMAVAIEPEGEEEGLEAMDEMEGMAEGTGSPDLEGMDLEELVEMYKELKG